MPLTTPRPDEFDPFYAGYISRVANVPSPVDELVAQRARLLNGLSPLSDEQAEYRYAAGKWSIKELVGHLSDAERIFAYRLLRIGRGDETPLPGFEENDYVRSAGAHQRPFGELLDEWAAARDATSALVRGMPAEAWERRGTANGALISARALVYIVLGHVEHHRSVLEDRYGLAASSR
jgi:uncharacterized damage-inducible protein DinB